MQNTQKMVFFRATPEDLRRVDRITEYLQEIRPDVKASLAATMRYVLAEVDAQIAIKSNKENRAQS